MSGEADTKKWGVHPGAGKARPTFICHWLVYLDFIYKNVGRISGTSMP